jgi:glycosyltransferase involved in cell wall biosynthesis
VSDPDLSVVIFAFNEEANIAPVLLELRQWLCANEPSAEIVFVDDGSLDHTSAEAAKALSGTPHQLVRHDTNRGIGARATAARERTEVVFSVYDHRDDGLHRKILSAGVRALILMVHGVRMRSDGPYLFRHALFDPDQLVPDTFFLNFEFPIRMLSAGVSAAIVTIECRPRRSGHSKSTGLKRIYGVMQDLLELRVRRVRESLGRNA